MWLSAFALLGTAALIFCTALMAAFAAMFGRTLLARLAALAAAGGGATYLLVLLASGLASPGRELALGEEKHICEIDCHLAYSVAGVERAGDNYTVMMRVRFDERTISAHRGDRPLMPGRRTIVLIDADGLQYEPVSSTGLTTALRPGQTADAQLEFRVPANVKPVYLRFQDADPIKRLLIGSETAPLHGDQMFRLS